MDIVKKIYGYRCDEKKANAFFFSTLQQSSSNLQTRDDFETRMVCCKGSSSNGFICQNSHFGFPFFVSFVTSSKMLADGIERMCEAVIWSHFVQPFLFSLKASKIGDRKTATAQWLPWQCTHRRRTLAPQGERPLHPTVLMIQP